MSIIQLRNVRLAFPVLWEPKTVQGEGEPAYSAAFLLPPDHPQIKEIQDATERVGKEKWKDQWAAVKKALTASDKLALHDGDTRAQYAGYEGTLVIDRDKTVLIAADGRPYAGCFVNASLEIWAQSNGYGKRINASLRAVQFVKDGDSFGGGTPANADEFDDLSNGADNLEDVA
jgi:hypothetical protein